MKTHLVKKKKTGGKKKYNSRINNEKKIDLKKKTLEVGS
jgi:hypothetical protein